MSDTSSDNDEQMAGTGGNDPQLPQMRIMAQYIKDLSFENPNAPSSLMSRGEQPGIELNVDVQARRGQQDQYEVDLRLSVQAKIGDQVAFITELVYSGLFMIRNVPETDVQPFLFIECPRFLFPFARRIVAECTADGGFPPLMIDPIDFASLMRRRIEQGQAAQNTASENGPPSPV